MGRARFLIRNARGVARLFPEAMSLSNAEVVQGLRWRAAATNAIIK
jgi:hypothetical protein